MSNIVKHDQFKEVYDKVPRPQQELLDAIIPSGKDRTIPIRARENTTQTMEDISSLAVSIAKDYGAREPERYQIIRFYEVMIKYYGDLTTGEIKLAYTLGVVGALNEYLPDGDNNAYGEFSLKFATKILNAYRRKKSDMMTKIRKQLPAPESTITQEERKSNSARFVADIKKWYDQYLQGITPDIYVIDYTYSFMKGSGMIPRTIDITEQEIKHITERKSKSIGKEIPKSRRNLYIEMINEGNIPDEVRRNAMTSAKYNAILRAFENLKQSNESIEQYL